MTRVLAALAAVAAFASPAAAQTADEVVARTLDARGGLTAIRAIQSIRMSGRMKMGPTFMPIVVEIKRGAGLRTEISLPDATVVQAFDGRAAWGVAPGGTQPEVLPEDAAKQMAQQADFEGVLVEPKAKGHRVELVGKEKGATAELYRLRVTLKDGDVDDYLIDGSSWLPVRVESKREVRGELVEGRTTIGDYVEAGGWKWPRLIENAVKGRQERQSITFDKIEVGPVIADSRFRKPANAAPASGRSPRR